jgi:hypothetical protein
MLAARRPCIRLFKPGAWPALPLAAATAMLALSIPVDSSQPYIIFNFRLAVPSLRMCAGSIASLGWVSTAAQ